MLQMELLNVFYTIHVYCRRGLALRDYAYYMDLVAQIYYCQWKWKINTVKYVCSGFMYNTGRLHLNAHFWHIRFESSYA